MEYGAAPEDPAASLAWLDAVQRRFRHFIGGRWRAPADGEYFESHRSLDGREDRGRGAAAALRMWTRP